MFPLYRLQCFLVRSNLKGYEVLVCLHTPEKIMYELFLQPVDGIC
jgi:hypothetical protein